MNVGRANESNNAVGSAQILEICVFKNYIHRVVESNVSAYFKPSSAITIQTSKC